MSPGPERCRVSGTPLTADDELFDRGAGDYKGKFSNSQSNERADNQMYIHAQQAGEQNYIDKYVGDGQYADAHLNGRCARLCTWFDTDVTRKC